MSDVQAMDEKVKRAAQAIREIHHLQCSRSCCHEIWDADGEVVSIDEAAFRALDPLPECGYCSAVARPNVLMFGDWCWLDHRTGAQQQRFTAWLHNLEPSGAKVVVIELGAGTAVPTVRHTSEEIAQRLGGTLVRINPREPMVRDGHIGLPLGALEGVKRVVEQLDRESSRT